MSVVIVLWLGQDPLDFVRCQKCGCDALAVSERRDPGCSTKANRVLEDTSHYPPPTRLTIDQIDGPDCAPWYM